LTAPTAARRLAGKEVLLETLPEGSRIMAACTVRGCRWACVRLVDGSFVEGAFAREVRAGVQDGAGIVCRTHRPAIEAVCVCRRRCVDGIWESSPLPRDIPIAADVPQEECPRCIEASMPRKVSS
jgi:hypothetical protein